jgi:DNA repair photolyase
LQLRVKKNEFGIVAVGSATDAYMPHEAQYKMTEGFLKLFLQYRFPVFISTKSTLILRDIQLLKKIDAAAILPPDLKNSLQRGVILSVSISSMEENISNILEPGAAKPLERLKIVGQLKAAGFLVGVNGMPVLPFISDTDEELEKIIVAAKEHSADYILIGGLTLFGNDKADSKTLYYKFLERYDPSLIPAYDNLYKGASYPPSKYQEELRSKAEKICKKYNIKTGII